MATITTRPMTFEEFAKLPEPQGFRYELHHGELVEMPFPKMTHSRVLRRLRLLIEGAATGLGVVESEFGFVSVEDDYRRSDIMFVPQIRWDLKTEDDYFHGAPDLVVEILSRSNTMAEMRDKRKICLSNGAIEFWLVDPEQREVEVYRADRELTTYRAGQQIPLFFADGATIPLNAIFA
jgi:Uma2 family endonuclease